MTNLDITDAACIELARTIIANDYQGEDAYVDLGTCNTESLCKSLDRIERQIREGIEPPTVNELLTKDANAQPDTDDAQRALAKIIQGADHDYTCGELAGSILDAIQRKKVPRVYYTSTNFTEMTMAHVDEIKALRARLVDIERCGDIADKLCSDQAAECVKLKANLAAERERATRAEMRLKFDVRPGLSDARADADRLAGLLRSMVYHDCVSHVSYCRANCGPEGEGWVEDDKCDCGLKELRTDIKAALVAHDAGRAGEGGQVTKLPFKLPRRRYVKDRSVSDYTYSSHADGFDDCLHEIEQLLDLHGITFDELEPCTKESLGLAGIQEDD